MKNNCHPELDSGSIQHCELPVLLDRCRNGLARLAENVPTCFQHFALRSLAQFGMTLKNIPSLRAVADRVANHRRSSRFHNGLVGLRSAFTMAEILLSLTIIGVVAAITLPSLTGNINERTWNTQRKALYARFSQALALMPSLSGYGTYTEESSSGADDAMDNAAETFITAGLSKVLKINNICDYKHLEDCGIPTVVNTLSGGTLSKFTTDYNTLVGFNEVFKIVSYSQNNCTGEKTSKVTYKLDTRAAAFETANGESILIYYNPSCTGDMQEEMIFVQPKMCANFVYDLNGSKGPNTVGKDIGFITALYPSDPVIVAPLPLNSDAGSAAQTDASKLCRAQDSESRLPNIDELSAMFINKNLLELPQYAYWSGTVYTKDSSKGWAHAFINSETNRMVGPRSEVAPVRCIKR